MVKKKQIETGVLGIYGQTLSALRDNPTIILLFLIIAVMDLLALTSLFLAHSKPFSLILAPIIRRVWSEVFLHYPDNFILLPKLLKHAHNLIITFFGTLFTGVVILKIHAYMAGSRLSSAQALGKVFSKYLSLIAAWWIAYALIYGIVKVVMGFLPAQLSVHLAAAFILGVLFQALFVFLIPSLLLSGHGFFKGMLSGFVFGLTNVVKTSVLIAVPILILTGLSYLKALAPVYNNSGYPEAMLWVLAFGIIVSMLADMLITSTTAVLYINKRRIT